MIRYATILTAQLTELSPQNDNGIIIYLTVSIPICITNTILSNKFNDPINANNFNLRLFHFYNIFKLSLGFKTKYIVDNDIPSKLEKKLFVVILLIPLNNVFCAFVLLNTLPHPLSGGHVATADINDSKKLLLNNCAALNGIVNNNADTIDIAVNTAS